MVAEIRKTIRGEVRVTAAIAVLIESGLKPSQTNLLTTKQAKSPKKQSCTLAVRVPSAYKTTANDLSLKPKGCDISIQLQGFDESDTVITSSAHSRVIA